MREAALGEFQRGAGRSGWASGAGGLPCDPGDTRPHNLQVGADAGSIAFVFCFVFFFSICLDAFLPRWTVVGVDLRLSEPIWLYASE